MDSEYSSTTAPKTPELALPVLTLAEFEMQLVGIVAVQRHAQNTFLGRKLVDGEKYYSLERHFTGVIGEYAVAKYTGKFWNGQLGKMSAKDVGKIQVRASLRGNPCLILHPRDDDDDVFVLVSVWRNRATLLGWLRARDGKRDEYWRTDTGRPAWFVPRYLMRPPKPPI